MSHAGGSSDFIRRREELTKQKEESALARILSDNEDPVKSNTAALERGIRLTHAALRIVRLFVDPGLGSRVSRGHQKRLAPFRVPLVQSRCSLTVAHGGGYQEGSVSRKRLGERRMLRITSGSYVYGNEQRR